MNKQGRAGTLTVAILARDEEQYIVGAIDSARELAAPIVVLLDSRTTDSTASRARAAGAEVISAPFRSFASQRNHMLQHCPTRWLLFLDADERIAPELGPEICSLLASDTLCAGYWIPRRNRYWHWWLRGGGWYPDHQLRLLDTRRAHYNEQRLVHEYAALDGPAGYLRGHLLHWNIDGWDELRRKQHHYALAEAQTLFQCGTRAQPHNLVLQPLREVHRRFWTWQGYRDGLLGLLLAISMGYYELIKYLHLYALPTAVGQAGSHGRGQ
ncbi:MAG: glycosyltransferase family 2 protein [Herpetosiphon sp.]